MNKQSWGNLFLYVACLKNRINPFKNNVRGLVHYHRPNRNFQEQETNFDSKREKISGQPKNINSNS